MNREDRLSSFSLSLGLLLLLLPVRVRPLFFWKAFFKIRAQPLTAHDALLCHKY